MNQPTSTKTHVGKLFKNGIDRIDNNKLYINNNCVPACWSCNKLKGTFSVDKFLKTIKLIFDKHLKEWYK